MLNVFLLLMIFFSSEATATYDAGRIAFEQGEFQQAYQLWLETANGDTKSVDDSFQWTQISSEQQRNAQYAIAILYWQGKGVTQNYLQSAHWLRLAVKSGHLQAQSKLGYLYLRGHGVDKDEKEARKKFIIAANHGFTDAQYNLGMLYLMGVGGKRNMNKAKFWLKQAALQGDAQAFEELMKFDEVKSMGILSDLGEKNMMQSNASTSRKQIQLHEPAWLLNQTDKVYAVQVLAMHSLQQLKDFTATLPANDDWVYFLKRQDNKKFFILLRCCFQDKKEATAFRQHFSSIKQKLQPFIIEIKNALNYVKTTQ